MSGSKPETKPSPQEALLLSRVVHSAQNITIPAAPHKMDHRRKTALTLNLSTSL